MPTLHWRLVTTEGSVSEAIRFVSRGTVSHVEFLLDDCTTLGAQYPDGVQIRPVDYATFSADFRYSTECTQAQYDQARTFLLAQVGKPYDFFDIGSILFNRNWHDPSKWICSELWAATMESAGLIRPLHAALNLITPEDCLLISSALFTQGA